MRLLREGFPDGKINDQFSKVCACSCTIPLLSWDQYFKGNTFSCGHFQRDPMNQLNQDKLIQSSCFFLSAACIIINPLYKYTCTVRDVTRTLSLLLTQGQICYSLFQCSQLICGMVLRAHLAKKNSCCILHSMGYTQEYTVNTASLYWGWDKIVSPWFLSWRGVGWVMNTLNLHSLRRQERRNITSP